MLLSWDEPRHASPLVQRTSSVHPTATSTGEANGCSPHGPSRRLDPRFCRARFPPQSASVQTVRHHHLTIPQDHASSRRRQPEAIARAPGHGQDDARPSKAFSPPLHTLWSLNSVTVRLSPCSGVLTALNMESKRAGD
ncbi:hypothetical protein BKA81DRAFT_194006 [Phyllosticta paracitricarpa]